METIQTIVPTPDGHLIKVDCAKFFDVKGVPQYVLQTKAIYKRERPFERMDQHQGQDKHAQFEQYMRENGHTEDLLP